MNKNTEIFIANWSTRIWMDDIRFITNDSAGTTWAFLWEEFVESWYKLHYLWSKNTLKPYDKRLEVDKDANIIEEIERIKKELEYYQEKVKWKVDFFVALDFQEYHKKVLDIIKNNNIKIAIFSVAWSDFWVEKTKGKIKSSDWVPDLKLEILPKIISDIKKIRKDIFLVWFKLLKDSSPDELIEIAYKSMLRDHQDISVANISRWWQWFWDFLTYLVTIEKWIIPVKRRKDLQKILKETIENRYSEQYYKTELEKVEKLPISDGELESFISDIHNLSHLALFSKYLEWKREEFWFIAKRTELWTLLTSRWSSKSEAWENDLALITDIDKKNRVIKTKSVEKKASLNWNVAHLIMENRPDVNYIVHSHINLPNSVKAIKETSPWTHEDWESVKDLVLWWEKIIYQQNHWVLILLDSLSELIPLLQNNNIYAQKAELYDIAYQRFQKNTRFVDIVEKEFKKDWGILDMCAWTWEVSLQLIEKWFKNITAQDTSKPMLEQAIKKVPSLQTKQGSFEEFNEQEKYDWIIIRQAINYIKPDDLINVFTKLRDWLKNSWKLVFNTFIISDKTWTNRRTKDELWDKIVITEEWNLIVDNLIHHWQKTQIFDQKTWDYDEVYDLNSFYSYSKNDFEFALKKGWFSNVEVIQEKKSLYFICIK